MTNDTSTAAVERVCFSLQRFLDTMGLKSIPSIEIDTLRALSAERDAAVAALQRANTRCDQIDAEWADRLQKAYADTRKAQAETAAAYERAADMVGRIAEGYQAGGDGAIACALYLTEGNIRALKTPDQTAALDAVVAKAWADGMREAAEIINRNQAPCSRVLAGWGWSDKDEYIYGDGQIDAADSFVFAILAAIQKGGA